MPTFVIHRLQALLALDVPQPDRFVVGAGEQQAAVRGDGQTRHLVPGTGKGTSGRAEVCREPGSWADGGSEALGRYVWYLTCAL